jgi:hypothetical protein
MDVSGRDDKIESQSFHLHLLNGLQASNRVVLTGNGKSLGAPCPLASMKGRCIGLSKALKQGCLVPDWGIRLTRDS